MTGEDESVWCSGKLALIELHHLINAGLASSHPLPLLRKIRFSDITFPPVQLSCTCGTFRKDSVPLSSQSLMGISSIRPSQHNVDVSECLKSTASSLYSRQHAGPDPLKTVSHDSHIKSRTTVFLIHRATAL